MSQMGFSGWEKENPGVEQNPQGEEEENHEDGVEENEEVEMKGVKGGGVRRST